MLSLLASFGEIREPSSRAFWGDFDAEEHERQEKLTWDCSHKATPIPVDEMLLIEGHNIAEFGKQMLLEHAEELCKIVDKDISLYKLNGKSKIIGLLQENLVNSAEVANLLLPHCNLAKNVTTITIRPKVEYKSENVNTVNDEITCLRALKSELDTVENLETPNFIVGAAAGICSHRDIQNLPISSYIAFIDKSELDTFSAAPILKLLLKIGFKCPERFIPKPRDQSYLYM